MTDITRHYGNLTMVKAMNVEAPTVHKLMREYGQDMFTEALGRLFIGLSLYFDKPFTEAQGEVIAVEVLADYEMSNLKLEDFVVIMKELKESEIFGNITPNKIIKHIKGYWDRRVKTATRDSINHSQSNKGTSDMSERVKKTIALPQNQLNRVDRTRNSNKKYLK